MGRTMMIAAAGGLLLVGATLHSPEQRAPMQTAQQVLGAQPTQAARADGSAMLGALQRRTAELERKLSQLARRDDGQEPEPDPGLPVDPRGRELDNEAMMATVRLTMSEALEAEEFDLERTDEVGAALDEMLVAPGFVGTSVADVHCAGDLCQFRIDHNDRDAFDVFVSEGISDRLFRGSVFFDYDVDTRQTLVYHAPMGASLPTVGDPRDS